MKKKKRHSGKYQEIPEHLLPKRKKKKVKGKEKKEKNNAAHKHTRSGPGGPRASVFRSCNDVPATGGVFANKSPEAKARVRAGCLSPFPYHGGGGGGTDPLGNRLLPLPPALHGSAEGPAGAASARASFILRHTGPRGKS